MSYTWSKILKLSLDEIKERHQNDDLCGCLFLYPDNTECYIENYNWQDITKHIENGGEIGCEF